MRTGNKPATVFLAAVSRAAGLAAVGIFPAPDDLAAVGRFLEKGFGRFIEIFGKFLRHDRFKHRLGRLVKHLFLGRQGEDQPGALAEFAFRPDDSFVQDNQAPGNAEAKAGALVLADGGDIDLAEFVKELAHVVFFDADAGVFHAYFNKKRLLARLYTDARGAGMDGDPAPFGELDGIGQEIVQDLPGLVIVDKDRRQVRGEVKGDGQVFFLKGGLESGGGRFD
ncbi:hypothetical protein BMS3Abin13_00555 [bacterium BMS3Abin13]|nr:hypothetical protein BMS3Abin13_00555 [bacterium BMS3Abin13]